jgi:hypothetical protein
MFPDLTDIVICVVITLCIVVLYLRITDNDNKEESPYDKN